MKKISGQTFVMGVLAAVTVMSLCVTGWAVFLRPAQKLTDYAPAELEPNALPYETAVDSGAEKAAGGAVSVRYTKKVYVDTKSGTAHLYYANPIRAHSSAALQLVLVDSEGREAVLGQSGLLKPGTQLEELTLSDADCKPGSYSGKFILTFYDSDTNEKRMVNTVIEGLDVIVS